MSVGRHTVSALRRDKYLNTSVDEIHKIGNSGQKSE